MISIEISEGGFSPGLMHGGVHLPKVSKGDFGVLELWRVSHCSLSRISLFNLHIKANHPSEYSYHRRISSPYSHSNELVD